MTQEQKKQLGEIRTKLERIDAIENMPNPSCVEEPELFKAIDELYNIQYDSIKLLDALEAAGKCKRVQRGVWEYCSVCGWEFDDESKHVGNEKFCPGCGCEIEATE